MKSRHSGKQYAEIICKAIRHVYDGLYYKHRAYNVISGELYVIILLLVNNIVDNYLGKCAGRGLIIRILFLNMQML